MVLCVADKPGEGGSSSPSLQQSQTSLEAGERGRERERERGREPFYQKAAVDSIMCKWVHSLTYHIPNRFSSLPPLPLCLPFPIPPPPPPPPPPPLCFPSPLMTLAAWNDSSSQFGMSLWGTSPLCRPLHNMYMYAVHVCIAGHLSYL